MDLHWMVVLSVCFHFGLSQNCRNEPKCSYTRVKGMKAADCYQKNFREFPKCVSDDVEIIDLTYNRIRKLSIEDLSRYSYLKILYLQDNKIQSIDEEIFNAVRSLQTLDLSFNSLAEMPAVIFHLPSLKTLYLGQNWNMNIVDIIDKAKPITSPLVHLDISYILVDEPGEFPDLSIMPYLVKYNISGNKIATLSTKHFAGLCDLQILDTSNVTADFEQLCDCWRINNWLTQRHVRFTQFSCRISKSECADSVSEEDLKAYQRCREKIETIIQQSRLMKILIPCGVIAVIILIATIYIVVKRKKQKQIELRNRTAPPLLTVYNK